MIVSSPQSPWFVAADAVNAQPDAVRVFVFPHGGGNAAQYLPWQRQLDTGFHLYCANLPGRGTRWREAPMRDFAVLIKELRDAIIPLLGPRNIFVGHSLGSLIALELASALPLPADKCLSGLLVSAKNAPHTPSQCPPIHMLDDADFLATLAQYGGTPQALLENRELMEMMLPALRADFFLSECYERPVPIALDCPIHAFWPDADVFTSEEGMAQWSAYTKADFTLQHFPGGHFYLHEQKENFLPSLRLSLSRLATSPH